MRSCAQQGIGEGAGAETWLDDTNFNSRHDIFAAACVTPTRASVHKPVPRGYALHPSVCEPSAATERSNSRNQQQSCNAGCVSGRPRALPSRAPSRRTSAGVLRPEPAEAGADSAGPLSCDSCTPAKNGQRTTPCGELCFVSNSHKHQFGRVVRRRNQHTCVLIGHTASSSSVAFSVACGLDSDSHGVIPAPTIDRHLRAVFSHVATAVGKHTTVQVIWGVLRAQHARHTILNGAHECSTVHGWDVVCDSKCCSEWKSRVVTKWTSTLAMSEFYGLAAATTKCRHVSISRASSESTGRLNKRHGVMRLLFFVAERLKTRLSEERQFYAPRSLERKK